MKTALRPFYVIIIVLALITPALADTIRLKDGSVIRGQVVGFRDQQFTVLIGSGAQGRRSRTLIYVEDVESIEFDSATTSAAAALANEDSVPGNTSSGPVSQPQRNTSSTDSSRVPPRITTTSHVDIKARRPSLQSSGSSRGWYKTGTNSGLSFRRPSKVTHQPSTGRVSLGGAVFNSVRPFPCSPDNDNLMPTEPTGALIAASERQRDFLLDRHSGIFVAQRDGGFSWGQRRDLHITSGRML